MRAWELDVGKWERALEPDPLANAVKSTMMMNMAPIFLTNNPQSGENGNIAALRKALLFDPESLEHPRPRHLSDIRKHLVVQKEH